MGRVLHRLGQDDAQLARRVGAGDSAAFAVLDERHRSALTRYAGSLLRRSQHDAEDVVQDVLIRAHQTLRGGDLPDELRPWLYRLTRNRAIDEVRRKRWGDESLSSDRVFAGDERQQPDSAYRRKESLRRLIDDLADLPVRQRAALLARELDGDSPEQVAAQLGVSVHAAQKLAIRARENLIKARNARDADCDVVRAVLLEARERGVRPTEHGLRHVRGCDACRAYQRDIRQLSKRLHALTPAYGLPLLAGLAKLLGGGGGAGAAAAGAAAAAVLAVSGGVVALGSDVLEPGDLTPFELHGTGQLDGKQAKAGDPVPPATKVVTARVRVPRGAPPDGKHRSVTLACPDGMKFAGLQSPPGQRSGLGTAPDSIIGHSTRGTIRFLQGPDPPAFSTTIAIVCRRPDANGSLVRHPRLPRPGEQAGRVCSDSEQIYRPPPGRLTSHLIRHRFPRWLLEKERRRFPEQSPYFRMYQWSYVHRGQPVSIQRRDRSGKWTRIVPDTGVWGWIRTSALC